MVHVSYVYSQNLHARGRMKDEFNFFGTPTVWFDGGDETVIGGYSGCKTDYEIAIRTCGIRPVPMSTMGICRLLNGWRGVLTVRPAT